MQHEIAKPIFVDFELNVAINVSFFKLMKMISNMKMRKENTLNENEIHNNTYLNNGYYVVHPHFFNMIYTQIYHYKNIFGLSISSKMIRLYEFCNINIAAGLYRNSNVLQL